jgi:hypothetical protein
MIIRTIFTVLLFTFYSVFLSFYDSTSTLSLGSVAGSQLSNSDIGYIGTMASIAAVSSLSNIVFYAVTIVFCMLWYKPVWEFFKNEIR